MSVNRTLSRLLGCALLLGGLTPAAEATPVSNARRSPIEFRLHQPEASASMDADIWAPSNPSLILRTQQEVASMRAARAPEDPRAPFSEALFAAATLIPGVGQFANEDWMKGAIALGTAAGLTTAIVLGQSQNQPDLVRVGTLGLYPLVIFGSLDAFATRQHRSKADPATLPPQAKH